MTDGYFVDLMSGEQTEAPQEDEELPALEQPQGQSRKGRQPREQDREKYPRDPYRWLPMRIKQPPKFIPKAYDDPFVRWGIMGRRYIARFSVLASRLILQIAHDLDVPREKLGYRLYRGHGDDVGKFAMDICEFERNGYTYKLSEASWRNYMTSGGAAWRDMQFLGYSKVERIGNSLIGTLGDYRGFAPKIKDLEVA